MSSYRRKPKEIEAVQWNKHGDDDRVSPYAPKDQSPPNIQCEEGLHCDCGHLLTDHGVLSRESCQSLSKQDGFALVVCPGYWLVEDPDNYDGCWPVNPEHFDDVYEPMEEG